MVSKPRVITKEENGNTQAVMDGSLNRFIRAYLLNMIHQK